MRYTGLCLFDAYKMYTFLAELNDSMIASKISRYTRSVFCESTSIVDRRYSYMIPMRWTSDVRNLMDRLPR